MSYLEDIPAEDVSPAMERYFQEDRDELGYVANYTQLFARRPEVYEAWEGLNRAVRSTMDRRRYHLATLAAARQLRSSYCSIAHGTRLAALMGEQGVIDLMGPDGLDSLSATDAAVVTLAERVAAGGAEVTEADIEAARSAGLDDQEIFDVILTAAARCFFSTVLDATGTQPDAAYRSTVPAALTDVLVVGRPIED